MKRNCKFLPVVNCLLLFNILFFSCKKENQRPIPATLDYNLLAEYKWLITNGPDTGYFLETRSGVDYRVQHIVTDTTALIYNADSTCNFKSFFTEIFNPETTPYTGGMLSNYMPLGSSDFTGTYSVNQDDSAITTINQISGVVLPAVVHKIRTLTSDSLILWHVREGERRYHSVVR